MNMLARQAAVYPALVLDPLDEAGLDERDAAFAHAVYDAAIRRWITLGYLIERYTPRGLRENHPAVQAALLAGAAQIFFLDKVPPHAAINASVEWAKRAASTSVGGFVNAVLRKVVSLAYDPAEMVPPLVPSRVTRAVWTNRADEVPLGDGGSVQLRAAVLPEDRIMRVAVATSHPGELVRHWARVLGEEVALELCLHDVMAAPTTVCTGYARGELPQGLVAHGDSVVEGGAMPVSCVWEGSRGELMRLMAGRTDMWVQDAGSTHPVEYLKGVIGDVGAGLVVDLCAGQGTKTRQLARAFAQARVIGADPAPQRAGVLAKVVAGIGGGRCEAWTVSEVHGRLQRACAVVLVDVPCTNTGVLARRAEAKYRADEVQLARLVETQREIVGKAVRLLAPGGVLCYSTCSVEPAENDEQALWIEQTFGLARLGSERWMPKGKPGEAASGYSDASYCAIFRAGR